MGKPTRDARAKLVRFLHSVRRNRLSHCQCASAIDRHCRLGQTRIMSTQTSKLRPIALLMLGFTTCANNSIQWSWEDQHAPSWERYKAEAQPEQGPLPTRNPRPPTDAGRFTFYDLKNESDTSLATRLLGENGKRIAYIDRQPSRWQYYADDKAAIGSIDLYTRPAKLGSQYGLCGIEKYSFRFDSSGRIKSLELSNRFGIEGNIFQKDHFDWDNYTKMCEAAPASHAPSYFPAKDPFTADDAARVLVAAIDISASSVGELPFRLVCTRNGKSCSSETRSYLGELRLKDIDDLSFATCPIYGSKPNDVCFTVEVGRNQLGPFPKYLTVSGSTYMNNIEVYSVSVTESSTVS
jgi:hypothetical protein